MAPGEPSSVLVVDFMALGVHRCTDPECGPLDSGFQVDSLVDGGMTGFFPDEDEHVAFPGLRGGGCRCDRHGQ